jgi:hypothetical protein
VSWVSTPRGRRWKGDDGQLYASAVAELQAKQRAPGSTFVEQLTGTRFVEPLARALDPSKLAKAIGSSVNQLARSVHAAVDPAESYRQNWERQNQADLNRKALLSRVGSPNAIVTGLNERGEIDLTKSDEYKRFAFTPEGQFDRYFKTPEMDQYFGAVSRGAAAPKDFEAMKALAGKTVAPGKTPEELSAFYRAESAMGRAQMPQIQQALGYEKGSALSKWAEANPMLAQRLYAKEMGRREAAGQVSPDVAFAANAVPAPWDTQGAKVSGEFAGVVPFQAAKTTGEGMPQFETTVDPSASSRAAAFLKRSGL